ncbi:MAG TPA: FAD-dependent oxidoreductase [Hyphomicrobiaceae bacterium]|jgi:2-octaprenyl-6-methoxyphenol hydroxylase|nr:FAD-dependent oxidoreductase [Hyphomicrobiaceae bacterium]
MGAAEHGETEAQIAVVGAGLTGLAAAAALSQDGFDVAVAAPAFDVAAAAADTRSSALLPPSVQLLENLDVWQACGPHSAPLLGARLIDDSNRLVRAPEVLFQAREIGQPTLGANVPNAALSTALNVKLTAAARLRWLATTGVAAVEAGASHVRLRLTEGGWIRAALVVAADGRHSIARAAAGIAVRTWDYPQAAIASSFCHTRPHEGITTELHRRAGPLTTVPLPGLASSLIWVEDPDEAARLAALSEANFKALLEHRLQGFLGTIVSIGPRALFPLRGLSAAGMAARRIALVGEAAHVLAPIGAQGLNLGLRDVAALSDCVAEARASGRDLGGPETLRAYSQARAVDVATRTALVDLLNRSLLTDFLPAQAIRSLGLQLLARSGTLRQWAIRGGANAPGPLPRLMRAPFDAGPA